MLRRQKMHRLPSPGPVRRLPLPILTCLRRGNPGAGISSGLPGVFADVLETLHDSKEQRMSLWHWCNLVVLIGGLACSWRSYPPALQKTVSGGDVGPSAHGSAHGPGGPAVVRGGTFMGFPERFNRYYTDQAWKPETTIYVSPVGGGDGRSRTEPANVEVAMKDLRPGTMIVFMPGQYSGCYHIDAEHGGTYDKPAILYGERQTDGSLGVSMSCCSTGSRRCFDIDHADYLAIDGFELVGGIYGVRAVGEGFAANQHQKGIAVLNSVGHGQHKDPFFTGQSDWFVIEQCTAYDSGSGDGHGIYLSNGSDWNIARYNETFNTVSSDFQINADPLLTCAEQGIAFDDPECDALAGSSPTGGRGASDFILVEGNFFHHSKAQGANFASVRNSLVRNNIFAFPTRHGASFYQETKNPKLGSSHNVIVHNLLVTAVDGKRLLSVLGDSTGNRIENNVVMAVRFQDGQATANPKGELLATDASTRGANTFEHNAWISGTFGSEDQSSPYAPGPSEYRWANFDVPWFATFPFELGHEPAVFAPSMTAPWLDKGKLLIEAPVDRNGRERHPPVDLGPYER
jgi:hypothetical protein